MTWDAHDGTEFPAEATGSPSHTAWRIPSFTAYIAMSATWSASRLVSTGASNGHVANQKHDVLGGLEPLPHGLHQAV